MCHSLKRVVQLSLLQSLDVPSLTATVNAVNHAKYAYNLYSRVQYSQQSGEGDNGSEHSERGTSDPTCDGAIEKRGPISPHRVNPRLLGHKQLANTLQSKDTKPETTPSLNSRNRFIAKPKSARQLLLSKQRSLSPASRVASMLPTDFWQDAETHDAVSSLTKSAGASDLISDSDSNIEEDYGQTLRLTREPTTPFPESGVKSKIKEESDRHVTLHQFLSHIKGPVWSPSPKVSVK